MVRGRGLESMRGSWAWGQRALSGVGLTLGERLAEVDELGEGVAVPGDDHGPGFDAAMAVDAGFEGAVVEEVVDVDGLGLFDHAGDLDGPGAGLEGVGVVGGVGLVGAELVK